MILSDISIKRPILAIVVNILFLLFGIVFLLKLPLREYPNVDIPVVSVQTTYTGASAEIIEKKITKIIEDRIVGLEGIDQLTSQSQEGVSNIVVQFKANRDLDLALNDVRDKVISATRFLPVEADSPTVSKASQDDQPIIWLNLQNKEKTLLEITDFANQYIVDKFSSLEGVARVNVGGNQDKSLRIWLDYGKLYANGLTPEDIVKALSVQNIEVPSGSIDSKNRSFLITIDKGYNTQKDFSNLVIKKGSNGYPLKLQDIARVSVEAVETRNSLRGNGVSMVGIGIVKQSSANTLAVARAAKKQMVELNQALGDGYSIESSYDSSLFIEASLAEVYKTLFFAIIMVMLVVFVFLNDWRTTLFICLSIPTSIVSTFIVLHFFGFSLNILTLLAIVLAIGLVVDDAIVIHENIYRRVQEGEQALEAAWYGSRQIAFAVVSTSLVLISVFIPISLIEGFVGKMFAEFAITIASAIFFSTLVSLTLSPALCSRFLIKKNAIPKLEKYLSAMSERYIVIVQTYLYSFKKIFIYLLVIILFIVFFIFYLKKELVPFEDRGLIFSIINAPEGSSFDYTISQVSSIEKRLMPLVEDKQIQRLILRVPGSFSGNEFNTAIGFIVLTPHESGRWGIGRVLGEIYSRTSDISGADFIAFPLPSLSRSFAQSSFEYVLQGPSYLEMLPYRDRIIQKMNESSLFSQIQSDYKETTPQIKFILQRDKIAEFGLSTSDISQTLTTLLASRKITNFTENGYQYDVIVEGEKYLKNSPKDILKFYVRSPKTNSFIQLANFVSVQESADATILKRFNRQRSVTISSNLTNGVAISTAISTLQEISKNLLPTSFYYNFKGLASDYLASSASSTYFFILSLFIIYLVLAAQFENLFFPIVILVTVPLAVIGGLLPLFLFFKTLNIFSQFGLLILMGISTKNGILIVEFANQLREEGKTIKDAIIESCKVRLRPILMTNITAIACAIPLILNSGPGSETRTLLGLMLFFGVFIGVLLTLIVIPTVYMYIVTTFPKYTTLRNSKIKLLV
ncbi:MAG: efflux RND transporter permease subunit [Methylacidiphilales bacterium]|nr:efflux RND transporter permease subunit [Candidatus Methylacidiphilales bacterium]